MKVDGGVGFDLDMVGAQAQELEEMGYSGLMSAETAHDPFFPLLVAAQHTEKVELMTSIAVAFARSPMTLANICLLYTSPSPRDQRGSRMPSSA